MARLARLTLADRLHHVIQRGNNRQPIFVDDADRLRMLALLAEHAPRCDVALHAHVLMDNHFHLLATPSTDDGLSKLMQAVGRGYVRAFNDRHGRTGTLWEGRYRSTVIQPERYLIACMVHMDQNPVRDGLAAEARSFPWSSHAHYIGLRNDRFLTPHPLYWALGNTPFAREACYAERVAFGIDKREQALLIEATLQGWAAGDADFVAQLQSTTPRRVVKERAGRKPSLPSD
ncbi:MAG: transposase [Janthinobacterium lividum]